MKIALPKILLGYQYRELDVKAFNAYFIIKQEALKQGTSNVTLETLDFKKLSSIADNRAVNRALENLEKVGLIKEHILNRDKTMRVVLSDVDGEEYTTNLDVELPYKNQYTLRLLLVYDYYNNLQQKEERNYKSCTSYEDIAKSMKISYTSISKARSEIRDDYRIKHVVDINEEKNTDTLDDALYDSTVLEIKFTEDSLEQELIKNMSMIEEGMVYIDNQVKIDYGRIDIVARDRIGRLCIIELKIEDADKRLPYQCSYYPTQFQNECLVRMIVISSNYRKDILIALNNTDVELYTYKLDSNNKLVGITKFDREEYSYVVEKERGSKNILQKS